MPTGSNPTIDTVVVDDGPPAQCGPPCDETWSFVGDLELGEFDLTTDQFRCMTRITGRLGIYDIKQDQLDGLRNLVSVGGDLTIVSNTLTNLSPFACLEEVAMGIQLGNAGSLTDSSGFSALRFTPSSPW